MLGAIKSNRVGGGNNYSNFKNELLYDYYNNYFESLSSRQLDREFNKDLSIMVNSLKKLPQEERKEFAGVISILIEFYLGNKIEKELNKSFHTLLKF